MMRVRIGEFVAAVCVVAWGVARVWAAPGAIGARSNVKPPPGSPGTTPAAPTSPWVASRHNKQKTNTQQHERRPQQASTKPGT